MRIEIDIEIDFSEDAGGRDSDKYSKKLRRYHKLLWSKRLPNGDFFNLDDTTPGGYLHYKSASGEEFWLASDAMVPDFGWAKHVEGQIPKEELEAFIKITYTIGGRIIFPGNKIDGKWTINQARGCLKKIRDRFDLTLECIRRHYCGGESPLSAVLERYARFFNLFMDFRGYVKFFLLEDLVSADFSAVKFSVPFDDFKRSPIPADVAEYNAYKNASIAFIDARNKRILASQP